MLHDDHRPPLAGGEILRHHQHAPGEHIGPDVETTSQAVHRSDSATFAARIERQVWRVEHADAVPPESLAIRARAFDEFRRG